VEYVWYTDSTGFGLWKRYEEDGEEKERPIYNQQQQAKWLTEEVRSDAEVEELSDDFLKCLNRLSSEIHHFDEENRDEARTIAKYRKELQQELDFKEKKIVSEILMYFGKPDLNPIDEMAELLDYAIRNCNLDLTDLESEGGDR